MTIRPKEHRIISDIVMGGISIVKIHIVQKGDTLWKISKKYGINFEQLKQSNKQLINYDMIMPGMKINIPTTGITKPKMQTNKEHPLPKEHPVQKEMPVQKEEPIKKKPKEVKKPEVTEPVAAPPPPPPAVPTPPQPMPPPKPEPQPSYKVQQAKMNVNFYHQPTYKKVSPPPPPPKKVVKEKPVEKPAPKPKPKPIDMVKPIPVDKLPEKKMPVKKPIAPKPMKKMPPKPIAPKPMKKMPPKPLHKKPMPHAPVFQQVGPVMEGCIPLSVLCASGCHAMHQNGMMYPQPQGLYQQPYQQPIHPHMHYNQAGPYHPETTHQPQEHPSQWQGYQRSNKSPEKEKKEDLRNNNNRDSYGDLTVKNTQNTEIPSQPELQGYYYGMVPWNYPVRQFVEKDKTNFDNGDN